MPVVHLISGLPRSGSTLLCNILAQNPRFAVGGTSGLVDMMLEVRGKWDLLPEFRAMGQPDSERHKRGVLRGMFYGYQECNRAHVKFDKSRSWLAHLEMAEEVTSRPVKVLVPVRDLRDVLASFEMLWRKVAPLRQIPYEARNYHAFQSVFGRCQVWTAADGPVGIAYNRVRDAFSRGLGSRLHLVSYERLTTDPVGTLRGIYEFLGESEIAHDFNRIEPVTKEDDFAYGFPGLHEIESKLRPARSRWRDVLGEVAEPFGALNAFIEARLPQRKEPLL